MAQNTIHIEFDPCDPFPADGYVVRYRPLGSGGAYRTAPSNFLFSPIEFVDNLDPVGTSYEGFIQGDCGGGKLGVSVPWVAEFTGSVPGGSSVAPSSSGSEPPPDFNITVENSSLDLLVAVFTIDGVNVPTPPAYATPGNTSNHNMATAASVNVHVEWTTSVGGQNLVLIDTNGVALTCENAALGDPSPEADWLAVDMTGPNPLALVLGDGTC